MGFKPYQDHVSVETGDDTIWLAFEGSEAHRSGEYMNERNATKRVKLDPETAQGVIDGLERAIEEVEDA